MAPSELGRGVVIVSGAAVPEEWNDAPRLLVDQRVLQHPELVVERLHRHWANRRPVVVELSVRPADLKAPEVCTCQPYLLKPSFEFWRERLQFLIWANNYDATRGVPVWWYTRLAQRAGASAHVEAEVDLGGPRWCDGGPRSTVPFPVLHRETIEEGKLRLTLPLGLRTGESLDTEQRSAVSATAPALRILAPAGSGKTRVLTARLHSLLEHGYESSRVLALAYNKRAAEEMVQRVAGAGSCVRTLHSLGFFLQRRFRPDLRLAGPTQVRQLLRGLIKTPPQVNADPLAPYIEALQTVRLALVDPETLEGERDDIPGFVSLFPRYQQKLSSAGLLDYDQQVYGCLELLLTNPQARKFGRRLCTHLLVDEFQDLTPAFLLLIRLLASPTYQVFGVGDDDQVIYGYAGASPLFLVDYKRYFPAADTRLLKNNYRCPSGVVDAANLLLAKNRARVAKQVEWTSGVEAYPSFLPAEQDAWASRGVEQIRQWLAHHTPDQIAVLSRVNSLLLPLQVALARAELPHNKVVDESLLQRTGLRSALAYWRLCTAEWRSEDLADALRRPNRRLRREIIEGASGYLTRTELLRFASK